MGHEFNQTRPLGGMDMDSEVRTLAPVDYLYGLNLRTAINTLNKGNTLTQPNGNVKVTKYLLPYNNLTSLPTGRNKCIGAFEDTKYNTVIIMVWNSGGKHQILRYYRDKTDPTNQYGEIQQVIGYNFSNWTKKTRITSGNIVYDSQSAGGRGDLFYWCDPIPRKINLEKANICYKQKSWEVILPIGRAGESFFFQVVVKDFLTNGNVASTNVNIVAGLTVDEMLSSLATQINANLGQYLTAEACDCKITITEKKVNGYNIFFTSPAFFVIPENWYGKNLIDRFWDRCKWPAVYAPSGTFKKDANYFPNYVQRKVFQFRIEYIYDDAEYSALGVWSQIPIDNLACNGTSDDNLNYIDVNFNDPLLTDPNTFVLLKKVRFIARELNTGSDRAIIDLEPCEFVDFQNNELFAHYKFYNNIISNTVDSVLAAKEYDNVPIEAQSELFIKNRIVEGGALEGYNAPDCANADYKITIEDTPNKKLYKVKFKVRILTYGLSDAEQPKPISSGRNFSTAFPSLNTYPFWQDANPDINYTIQRGGIFHDTSRTTNNFAFFGGGGFGPAAGGDFNIRAGMEEDFDQRIPEGGFPIYAAGTPYFGISKQKDIGLPVDGDGALDTSSDARKGAIGNYLYSGNDNDLYSEVEILVPEGEYIFRPASHWCSFNDKLGKGFMYDLNSGTSWQRTSTNVWGVFAPNSGNVPQYTAGAWQKTKEIKLNVTSDIDDGGTFLIMDLAPPYDFVLNDTETPDKWQPIGCYVLDSFGNTDMNATNFDGITVEKSIVFYNFSAGWRQGCFTDHNGFFFGITNQFGGTVPETVAIYMGTDGGVNPKQVTQTTLLYIGTQTDIINKTLQPFDFSSGSEPPIYSNVGLIYGAVPIEYANARQEFSTFIKGRLTNSNGELIPNALVIYQNGRSFQTFQDGTYSLIAWVDTLTANLGNIATAGTLTLAIKRTVDNLIFELSTLCNPTYPNGQEYSPVNIDPFGANPGEYNPEYPYLIPDFIINEGSTPAIKARKRGGKYIDGIRYYDAAGRLCSVVKLYEVYIPFETENLKLYNHVVDGSGTPYAIDTYKGGKPIITATLASSYKPPKFAATYQFMRTKNLIYGRYLQWAVNSVTYLEKIAQYDSTGAVVSPEITTAFANANATVIKINISNIIDYSRTYPNSTIGYQFEVGDRLRIMYDRSLTLINGLYDFEISSYDEATQSIYAKAENVPFEIKSGFIIEILNPKSVSDNEQQIFYEVGEVFACTAPGEDNNQHSVNTVTFTNGDTYWRGRNIPVNDDVTNFASVYPVVIEDASVSDFYVSLAEDIGRVGVVDPNFKQTFKPMLLSFSNQFIPSTAINGLSSFEPLNAKELDRAEGQIQRLLFVNNNMVVVSSRREISNYIQRITAYQADSNSGVLSLSDSFLGTDYVHSRQLGTDLPASVVIQDGGIFGWTNYMGNVWKYRGDGEIVISDVKMAAFFKGLSDSGVTDAVAVYDRYHEEYIITYEKQYKVDTIIVTRGTLPGGGYSIGITVPKENGIPDLNNGGVLQYYSNGQWLDAEGDIVSYVDNYNETSTLLTFNTTTKASFAINSHVRIIYTTTETVSWFDGSDTIEGKRWRCFYSFNPENYCALGDEVVAFKNGELWIQDKNPIRNNFFGIQYTTQLQAVFNAQPDALKVWNSCILKQRQDNNANDWAAIRITNDNNQRSRLVKGSWVKKGEHWYAAFKRDMNDITVPANLAITQGRALRSTSISVLLESDYQGDMKLYSWDANYTLSERTSK